MSDEWTRAVGELLALVVHDLRNPVATVTANLSFVREVGLSGDAEVRDAMEDVSAALGDVTRGLEQLGWIGRWLSDEGAFSSRAGRLDDSLRAAVQRLRAAADVSVELPPEDVLVQCAGAPLERLVEILLRNALLHAPGSRIRLRATVEGQAAVVDVRDGGTAVAEDLRDVVFTMEGQQALKGRSDGRYSRVAGLLAARALADGIGATLEAAGEDGAAVFRIRLPLAGEVSR